MDRLTKYIPIITATRATKTLIEALKGKYDSPASELEDSELNPNSNLISFLAYGSD